MKLQCPKCFDGTLKHDTHFDEPIWLCDGLVDPEDENKELQPCDYERPRKVYQRKKQHA